ncbi:hypothetical protein GXM_00257 [Nostoc sphaeroides CCNUC1]|uniref:Uncharacterized protein n=1 Tax=Nostoc sphaeroides CCNUC1 TaxID=2653204 RepID=A0A5P8VR68_9NOSO|nr:hypothetical protein GXM_00257 [Nostoc sphaeroides CCNUC1]
MLLRYYPLLNLIISGCLESLYIGGEWGVEAVLAGSRGE